MNENGVFNELVDRYQGQNAIFITDRGYESYNNFANVLEANNAFLIRVKDIHSKTSLVGSLQINKDGEFDEDVHRTLTKNCIINVGVLKQPLESLNMQEG